MKLHELLACLDGVILKGSGDVEITSISYDSRRVKPGALYVAITGLRTDGRRFVKDALASGAATIASESQEGIPEVAVQVEVKNARRFLAEVSARFNGYPDREMTVIGVTGTNGKTTFTYLVQSILAAAGIRTAIIGTTGFYDGEHWHTLSHTTPESTDLWEMLREIKDKGTEAVAMEISSHAIALKRVWGLDTDVAVFTNLTQDHLDFHASMEEYKETKFQLFERLKKDAVAVINTDDPRGMELLNVMEGKNTISYSVSSREADLWMETEEASLAGSEVVIHHRGLALPVSLRLPGKHNISNLAAAAGAILSLDVEPEFLKQGIQTLSSVPGRLEPVPNDKGFFVFVDYAHTPDALERLIHTARELSSGRVITLFGCGGDRDRSKRPKMGRIASELSDFVFVTSDNPRTEDPQSIVDEILKGVMTDKKKIIVDRREAIFEALRFLTPGDVLLVAGKGHEDYQILGTEKIHFDDREVVKEALRALP